MTPITEASNSESEKDQKVGLVDIKNMNINSGNVIEFSPLSLTNTLEERSDSIKEKAED